MIRLDGVPVLETGRPRLRAPMAQDSDARLAFQRSERFRSIDPESGRPVRLAARLGAVPDYDWRLADGSVLRVFCHPSPAGKECAA